MEASKHCFLCVHVLVTGGGGAGAGGDCADALKKAYFFFQRLYFCVIIKLDLLLKNIFKSWLLIGLQSGGWIFLGFLWLGNH